MCFWIDFPSSSGRFAPKTSPWWCLEKGAHVPAWPWCCRAFLVCKGWLQKPVTTGSGNSGNHLSRQPFRIPSIPHYPNVGVQVERQVLPKITTWHRSVLIPAYQKKKRTLLPNSTANFPDQIKCILFPISLAWRFIANSKLALVPTVKFACENSK